ncbi:MAG TPA: amino acid ABC transporter permease [Desulfomonilia bacterium]|nr:amino acid ABC transporter permease [Desulfomonilia bacterium]
MNYEFNWMAVLTGEYRDWIIQGLMVTLKISAISIVLSLLLGTIVTTLRMTKIRVVEWICLSYIEFFRNTPLLVQIFFWYFGSYVILPEGVNQWLYAHDYEFAIGVVSLTIYTAAFIAEEIRSGIISIPKEQMESSRATGLSFIQSMSFVVLPQAFRIVIPTLISQFLNLIKNSSLVMTIGVMDLTYMTRQIESYSFRGFEAFTVATLLYIAISLIVSFAITVYNRKYLRMIKY